MNINKAMEMIKKKEFYEKGWIWGKLIVIDPFDFDLRKGQAIYEHFGITFISNSEIMRDRFRESSIHIWKRLTRPNCLIIDLDQINNELKKLSKRCLTFELLLEILEKYILIMIINRFEFNANSFSISYEDHTDFVLYVGSIKNLDECDIIKKAINVIKEGKFAGNEGRRNFINIFLLEE